MLFNLFAHSMTNWPYSHLYWVAYENRITFYGFSCLNPLRLLQIKWCIIESITCEINFKNGHSVGDLGFLFFLQNIKTVSIVVIELANIFSNSKKSRYKRVNVSHCTFAPAYFRMHYNSFRKIECLMLLLHFHSIEIHFLL